MLIGQFIIWETALSVLAAGAANAQLPTTSGAPVSSPAAIGPAVDHHQHLLSPAAARLLNQFEGFVDAAPPKIPDDISQLLKLREAAWNDPEALAQVYFEDSIVVEDQVFTGREATVEHVSKRFGRPYAITPVAYAESGSSRRIAAMYTRGEDEERTNVGLTLITIDRDNGGKWRIASETMKFPGPARIRQANAEALVQILDQANIQRAVVMSVAYFFAGPEMARRPDSEALVRQENDWTASEVARHSERLVAFCGINPLVDYALTEMQRCRGDLGMVGLKLHFGNSWVDLKNPAHLARVQLVFAVADRLGLPVAVHLWTDPDYGREEAEIFLSDVLAYAPNIVVQIMHMAGGGPGWTDEALAVFADAIEKGDPRTGNLYFDVATVATLQSHQQLQLLAARIRQIGPERILYGSDASFGGRNTADQEWGTFRGMVPLADAEFAVIRDNVAPYLRQHRSGSSEMSPR